MSRESTSWGWKSWRVDERLIRVPDEETLMPSPHNISRLYYIIEISEKNWNRMEKPFSANRYENTNVVFRIFQENGQYYYAYMYLHGDGDYIGQGDRCAYYQNFDTSGNEKNLHVNYVTSNPGREEPAVKLMAAVCRLVRPDMLTPSDKYHYCCDVKRYAKEGAWCVVMFDCPDLMEALFRYGDISEEDKAEIKALVVDVSERRVCSSSKCLPVFDRISSVERAEYFPNPKKKLKKGDIELPERELCKGRKGFVVPKGKKRKTIIVKLSDGNHYPYYAMDKVDDFERICFY